MFEEVPRSRRGVLRLLPVRRVVLGPFVVGSGMLLLAALGGSVAVAATVITASTIGSKDIPAHPGHLVPGPGISRPAPAVKRSLDPRSSVRPSASVPTPARPSLSKQRDAGSRTAPVNVATASQAASPMATRAPVVLVPSSPVALTPSASIAGGPAGNALIYVTGYDPATGRIRYAFATVDAHSGSGGGDVFQRSGSDTFSATVSASVKIISGGTLCPPAGSSCTLNQLIRAADSGFFAEAAIDAAGQFRSVIEVGGHSAGPALTPMTRSSTPSASVRPAPLVTRSPSPTASPVSTR